MSDIEDSTSFQFAFAVIEAVPFLQDASELLRQMVKLGNNAINLEKNLTGLFCEMITHQNLLIEYECPADSYVSAYKRYLDKLKEIKEFLDKTLAKSHQRSALVNAVKANSFTSKISKHRTELREIMELFQTKVAIEAHKQLRDMNQKLDEVRKFQQDDKPVLHNLPAGQFLDPPEGKVERGHSKTVCKKIQLRTTPVAFKRLCSQHEFQSDKKEIVRLLSILKLAGGACNVLQIFGHVVLNGFVYVVSQWCENDNLELYLKQQRSIDWLLKLRIASEVASALSFCHQVEVLHKDVRSYNVLLTSELHARLTGFERSRSTADFSEPLDRLEERARYMAPEKLQDMSYTSECDVYSFGVLLWEIATQKMPYENTNMMDMINAKRDAPLAIPEGTYAPRSYKSVMERAMQWETFERPDMKEVVRELDSSTKRLYGTRTNDDVPADNHLVSVPIDIILKAEGDIAPINAQQITLEEKEEKRKRLLEELRELEYGSLKDDHAIVPKKCSHAQRLYKDKKFKEAFKIFKELADEYRDPIAQFHAGKILLNNRHGEGADMPQALKYLFAAAAQEEPAAMVQFAYVLLNGSNASRQDTSRLGVGNGSVPRGPSPVFGASPATNFYQPGVSERVLGLYYLRRAVDKKSIEGTYLYALYLAQGRFELEVDRDQALTLVNKVLHENANRNFNVQQGEFVKKLEGLQKKLHGSDPL